MNFGNTFNPYGRMNPTSMFKRKINFSSILSNTQKTLGVINQAIPVFYQIKPLFNNIRTMFSVVNELNKSDNSTSTNKEVNNTPSEQAKINNNDGPNFFI